MAVPETLGVILAGGLSQRMGGGDKALLRLGPCMLVEHVIARLRPQCTGLLLSANGDPGRFARVRLPVVPDPLPGHPGPLAGLLAALDWMASERPDIRWLVSVPADTPFLPEDLVRRLHGARAAGDQAGACAASGGRTHPVVGLWPTRMREALREALVVQDMRKVGAWALSVGTAHAHWPEDPIDPFFNINRPEDLRRGLDHLNGMTAGHRCGPRPAGEGSGDDRP